MPEDYVIRSYRRNHKNAHAEDAEQGKIKRETDSYVKSTQRRLTLERELVANPDSEYLVSELAKVETAGEKVRRNARTHKQRLKKLKDQGLD